MLKFFFKTFSATLSLALLVMVVTNCAKDDALTNSVIDLNEQQATHRNCGAVEVQERLERENPGLAKSRQQIEDFTQQFIASPGAQERTVVTIPVVVHVVWNTTAQNISDAQIQSQLTVLNNDFRRLNADASNTPPAFQGIAADAEINFCLAQQDAAGNPTTGIVRRQTTVTSFSDNDAVKFTAQGGSNAWDASKYLNIWVCNLGGGLLGYAQFPGGPANTDGVVCTYTAFGTMGSAQAPFNLGRTATHEVGHWLNLFHIWGDDGTSCSGSDQCADTPNQADEHYNCPTFPQVSCSNGPNGDMFMNYMDYTDDGCMNLFTAGQKTRMQALFASGGARFSLTTSSGCNAPSGCGTPANLTATNLTNTSATLNWGAVATATSYTLQHKPSSSSTWTTVTGLTGTSYNLTGLTAGTSYQFQVRATCPNGTGAYSSAATFSTTGGTTCTDNYETNNTSSTAKAIPVGTTITAKIGTATDIDWFSFKNTTAQRRIKITLTNLPFDYDVYLYRGNTLVGASENAGTANEQIVLNGNNTVTTYRVKVVGYNGAYSNTACYSLLAQLSATNFAKQIGSGDETGGKQQTKIDFKIEEEE